jgi:hypothetical protein
VRDPQPTDRGHRQPRLGARSGEVEGEAEYEVDGE